jgi:hypothetical protein
MGGSMFVVTLVILLFIGLGAAWIVRRFTGSLSEASLLALLAAPYVVFGIGSGAVAEFAGFGITAKFNNAERMKVSDIAPAKNLMVKRIPADEQDFDTAARWQACTNYFVVRSDFGKRTTEPNFPNLAIKVASAIKSAMLCEDFYGLVVLDGADRFLGLFPPNRFTPLLAYAFDRYCIFAYKRCDERVDIAAVLAETELGPILKNPDVRADSAETSKYVVQETDRVADIVALPEFAKTTVFAVLDRQGKFVGLLPKKTIYDRIIRTLLGER